MKRSEFKRRKQCRRDIRRFFTATEQPYPSEEEGIPFLLRFSDVAMDYILVAPVNVGDYTMITLPALPIQEIETYFHIEFVDNKRYEVASRIVNNPRGGYFTIYFSAKKKEV